ncbi:MAG: D-tyrosyl-tRNA(Tyr) deacylase [Marinilabiliales bacterium]|nr:MAG: D-tyrosyl-tRNA(Tyr) deacylase [Marinilabiliales bacterium]
MRAVIQRVKEASVSIDDTIKTSIGEGLLILLGVEREDGEEDAKWLAKKAASLRIFDDEQGVMNLDINQAGGEVMVISQFTLHAKTKKGNRPSYIRAAPPETAVPLYQSFIRSIRTETGKEIMTGDFGAMMEIRLVNSGPVTIIIDTKNRE